MKRYFYAVSSILLAGFLQGVAGCNILNPIQPLYGVPCAVQAALRQ